VYKRQIYINFTGGTNNWVKFEDFTLWSLEYPIDPADLTAAQSVIDLIDALPSVPALITTDEPAVVAARTAFDALTTVQQTYVTNLLVLQKVEDRLYDLINQPLTTFNTEGTFESSDWAMSTIGWVTDGGNSWTDGDTAYSGNQAYSFFKDQSSLTASITKGVYLDAGNYDLTFYLQGGAYTSITVTVDGVSQTYTPTDTYAQFTYSFTSTGAVYHITVEVVRGDTTGWVTIDDMVLTLQP
jgi:hypothetical protein